MKEYPKTTDLAAKLACPFVLAWIAWLLWNHGVRVQFEQLPRLNYWFVFAGILFGRTLSNWIWRKES